MSQFVFPGAAAGAGSVQLSASANKTSTVTGSAVNVKAYRGPMLIVQSCGAISGTPTLDGKIQDSPDGSGSWADLTGATFAQVTAANNIQAIAINPNATRGFIRYIGTIGGGTPNIQVDVSGHGFK